jgi:hypothetical protein
MTFGVLPKPVLKPFIGATLAAGRSVAACKGNWAGLAAALAVEIHGEARLAA